MGWTPMEPDYETCGMTNWVGSFDPIQFIYFMLATVLIPYPTYVFVATVFNWEHRAKRPARHYQDLLHATSYGLIVFIFGNYARTLNWITILAFWITWPCYSMIAELDFAKTSLPNWKSWPFGMYALFAGATGVVLVFAGYHIYLGIILNRTIPGFIGYYLLALLIPVLLTLIGYACLKQQNSDIFGLSSLYRWMLSLQYRRLVAVETKKAKKLQAEAIEAAAKAARAIDPPAPSPAEGTTTTGTVIVQVDGQAPSSQDPQPSQGNSLHVSRAGSHDQLVSPSSPLSAAITTPAIPESQELQVNIQPYQPYAWSASVPGYFHPHHWQLFYILAFYTRFDHWVSRVGAGITLGCYMQGIMAYGYDYLIEE